MSDDRNGQRLSRRQLMATGAAGWATVSLAGCSRVLDPGPPTQSDDGNSGEDDPGPPTQSDDGNSGEGTPQEPSGNTTVSNETTTTGESGGSEGTQTGECASISRFASGMNVGLHVEVFDDQSGAVLGDSAVESVTVEFPDADFDPVELNWNGNHEAYSETTWGGKVETSEDTEAGTYRYEVTVQPDDDEPTTVEDEFTIV